MTEGAPLLELRGVSKVFGAVQALNKVDLSVPPGKVTALVGDNGAGKSVTIKTISGLWQPDGGTDPLGGQARPHPQPERRRGAGHHDHLPGPRAVRQPRHRPEHVPRAREAAAPAPRRDRDGDRGARDAGRPPRHHRALHPPARGLAVGRSAPIGRGGQGGHVGSQARDHGRAHRRTRRGADRPGARASSSGCRARARPSW